MVLVHKGLGVLVPDLDPGADIGLQGMDVGVDSALEQLGGEFGEPAFDLVRPGRAGRDKMRVKSRVGGQPPLDGVGLVGGVVVADQMDVEVGRDFLSSLARNFLNSMDRCRRCREPITCPVAMSRAANRLVTPLRR